ncbi:hypothetical protein V8F33_006061 [Rhypophila sp. PSN 637]
MGYLIRQHVSDGVLSEPQEGHEDATVPSRQGAPLQRLANEIKFMICEAVLSLPPRLPDDCVRRPQPAASNSDNLRDLVRLSMTCKALRTAALPVIYRQIDSAFARNLERNSDSEDARQTLGGPNQLAFLRTLNADRSLGRLVRSADLLMLGKHHPHNRRRSWHGCIEFLKEIGFERCSEHAMMPVPDGPSLWNQSLLSLLLSLCLFYLPNVRYLRIPSYGTRITSPLTSFRHLEGSPFFIFYGTRSDGPYSFEWKGARHAFPHLRELEIVSHIPKHDEPSSLQLDPLQPIGYLVRRSPSLCTLRLTKLFGIDDGRHWDLSMITSLILDNCFMSYQHVCTLARLCTNLRNFKISNSAHRDRRIDTQTPWQGEPGFESNIPLDLNREDECGNPKHGEILYCSDQVTASLVLDALSAASATLESISLGRCTPAGIRVDLFGLDSLNYNRRKFSIAKFDRLKRFAISSTNLFPGFYSPNTTGYDHVLSSILNERPTLESIKIFYRHRWEWSWGGQLKRAVRDLGQELAIKLIGSPAGNYHTSKSLTLAALKDLCRVGIISDHPGAGAFREAATLLAAWGYPIPTVEKLEKERILSRLREDENKLGREFRGLVCPKLEADILENFVSAGVEVMNHDTDNGVLFKLREGADTDYPHAPNLYDVLWETYLEIDHSWLN